ncbi:MAG: toxic anion resistance protein [Epsilonproteobacteria bacterium]|nr:MAG: toxic anion resistance protein [Campylobacterota bacterium]
MKNEKKVENVPEIVIANAEVDKVKEILERIDLESTSSVIHFGSQAQVQITEVSSQMLHGVKNKDMGQAGAPLSNMIAAIKGFDVDSLDPNRKLGFFEKLLGKAKPLVVFLNRYDEVQEQIATITDEMERQKGVLLHDIESLDRLYDANLDYVHELELYIKAGEEKLGLLDTGEIPALVQKADDSNDLLDAQALRDLRAVRDDFERRLHDLKLTRQVALQSLPSIRLVQDNDKTLISKMNSTLVNTVPLWKNQLAQTITIYRNQQAGEVLNDAMDLTNKLLEANAKNLKQANRQTRELAERGVFDIESVKLANRLLIETIEEGLVIAEEGKKARRKAESELHTLEGDLISSLKRVQAKEKELEA